MDNNSKIIINVGRQIGSGGRIVAQLLAERFKCRFYDREILNIAAKESGFSMEYFEQNDEHKNFFKSIFHSSTSYPSQNTFYNSEFSQDNLFRIQSEAIKKAAEKESCVFVGRCADYVLRDFPNVINIFITADLNDRIDAVSERRGCTPDEARKIITNGEAQRQKYYNYYTGKRWGHAESYDLCFNSSLLGIGTTAEMIGQIIGGLIVNKEISK